MTPDKDSSRKGVTELAVQLLEIIRALTLELQPGRSSVHVELDTDLDRDLGFDSLSRVELMQRIERGLDVYLPEQVFSMAETVRDVLNAILSARVARRDWTPAMELDRVAMELGDEDVPAHAETLQDVLAWRAQHHPDRTHIRLYEADAGTPVDITYADLQAGAQRLAAGLVGHGLEPAQAVAIMLPTGRDYLESFFGVLLAGAIPVPIYPPARLSQLEDHLRRHAKILANAGARFLITVPEARGLGRLMKAHVESLQSVVTPRDLSAGASFTPVRADANDVALLQYTSGSTGQPKGVVLTHAQLLANIRAMGERVEVGPEDTFVSWLPMYHDMGLIGAWLGSLYFAMVCVLMSPVAFLARPWRWLWTIQEHRATITAAPNFAYEMCVNKVPDVEIEGLDLSSLRLAFNGAEPVSPHTIRRFTERFGDYGLDPVAMTPVYGLAECAVGLAFPPLLRGPLIDRVQRAELERTGRAVPAAAGDPHALEFVACGQPLREYEIRIVDQAGRELAEREEGRLEFRGPSATRGYIGNPEATSRLFDGDWLDSGDLAYVSGGDVFLTSRVKDVIIRAGRNVYPYELEEAIGNLPDIRKGCVAVFGTMDPATDTEQLIVVAETRQGDADVLRELKEKIGTLAYDLLGIWPDDVLIVPPRTVLKTSSGKIRRAACRELYEARRIGRGSRAAWWQVVRLWLTGLRPVWRRGRRTLGHLGFAAYAYLVFGVIAPVAVVGLALLPTLDSRWSMLGWSGRQLLRLTRVRLRVEGVEDLPEHGRYVVVANHASYLDGLVLLSVLPSPVSMVAKAELEKRWFARWFLKRIDCQFVERFDVQQGTADARRLAEQARESAPLMFFPEGTFTRSPGLLPFHMGAFVTAAENGLSIVPITLRGTRSVLRSDDWFPRPGAVAVIIGAPLEPGGHDWQASLELRDIAREQIRRHLGEPDLAFERVLR